MRRSLALAPLLVVLAACGGSAPPTPTPAPVATPAPSVTGPAMLPILVSSELAKGPTRFLFALTDRANQSLAAPDVKVDLLFYDVDAAKDTVAFEADARFLWSIEGVRGLYVANVDFPIRWSMGHPVQRDLPRWLDQDRARRLRRARDDRYPGHRGPGPVGRDPHRRRGRGRTSRRCRATPAPYPRFYETSVAEALANKEAFVVAFATPAFCQTRDLRSDPRDGQGGRCELPRPDVHQRGAIRHGPPRRAPAAGARR